jgi:hypothetical protein
MAILSSLVRMMSEAPFARPALAGLRSVFRKSKRDANPVLHS